MMMNLPCLWGSCPNFLRPIYSYTECQPSCLTGSVPHGNDRCRLQLLFFHLIVTDHDAPYPGTDLLQWTLCLDKFVLVSLLMQFSFKLHHQRVSYPEPCPGPKPAGTSARFWKCYVFFLFRFLCSCLSLRIRRIFNVLKQLIRVVPCACFEDCVYYPQYLACNYD